MPLFRLFRFADRSVGNRRVCGLSTAELVGIIVVVGILGALSTTYISNLTTQSRANAGNQNAQSLNAILTSALSAGATVDTSSTSNAITALNTGVTVGSGPEAITFRVNPPVLNPGSYSLNSATNLFTYTTGSP